MSDDEFVEDALDRWGDARDGGRELSAAELCGPRPHLIPRVAEDICELIQWSDLRRAVGGRASEPGARYRSGALVDGCFRLVKLLAVGGQGEVWRATTEEPDSQVLVVKLVRHGGRPGDPSEGERALALRHPNIVPAYHAGKDGGTPYVVFEFMPRGTLATHIECGPLSPEEAKRVGRDLAAALAYVHDCGLIHRDLKPNNVLLDAAGRAYLTDFGIAMTAGERADGRRGTGTPAYMAPEQRRGAPDERCDIYALGVVLFEVLTGRLPGADSAALGPEFPPDLVACVARCLEPNPDDRWPCARSVYEALGGRPEDIEPPPPASLHCGSWHQRARRVAALQRARWFFPGHIRAVLALLSAEEATLPELTEFLVAAHRAVPLTAGRVATALEGADPSSLLAERLRAVVARVAESAPPVATYPLRDEPVSDGPQAPETVPHATNPTLTHAPLPPPGAAIERDPPAARPRAEHRRWCLRGAYKFLVFAALAVAAIGALLAHREAVARGAELLRPGPSALAVAAAALAGVLVWRGRPRPAVAVPLLFVLLSAVGIALFSKAALLSVVEALDRALTLPGQKHE